MGNEAQPRLAVILHADVVGSTTLVRQDERLAHQRIQAAFRGVGSLVERYGGTVNEVRGDALVAEFARASDAVLAALAAQEANRERLLGVEDGVAPVMRMGIALGEVVIADATVTGAGVVLAQRLEQLAEPGGICVSAAVREAVPDRLALHFESMGARELKGFDEAVSVHAVSVPEGTMVHPPQPSASVRTRVQGRRRLWLAAGGAATLLITVMFMWLAPWRPAEVDSTSAERMASSLPDKPSIAVLPFDNLSGDSEQDYFSDGMTNDIITDLSKFGALFVIASNSVFTYKNTPVNVQDASRELGVRYVLEGSVQRVDDRVRINAQLIDGTTGGHLWAQRYHRELTDVFAVQEEIVQTIVGTLVAKLSRLEQSRAFSKPTESLKAYDYWLRGQELLARTTRSANLQAREMFLRAIELDPRYASAYVELGWSYRKEVGHGWTEFPGQALERAEELAQKALSLAESAAAYRLLGYVYLPRAQYELATRALERAIALNPNDWESQAILGSVMLYAGRREESIRAFEIALRFDPNIDLDRLFEFGLAYYLEKRYEDAIRILEQGVRRNPDHAFLHVALAAAYAQASRKEAAAQEAAKVLRLHPFFEVASFGTRFRDPADQARLAEGLIKAGLE